MHYMSALFQKGSAALKSLRTREHRAMCSVLAEARKSAGLSQRELAAKLKQPHSFIGKIESGERRVDLVEFIRIARGLDLDPVELLRKVTRRHA